MSEKKFMLFEMCYVSPEKNDRYLRFVAQFDKRTDLWEYAGYHYKNLKEIHNLFIIEATQMFPLENEAAVAPERDQSSIGNRKSKM